MNHFDSGILFRIGVQQFPRAVFGTVIDADQFEVPECLRQNGVQAVGYVLFNVVEWHDHGNRRLHVLPFCSWLERRCFLKSAF